MSDVRQRASDILNTCESVLARATKLPEVDRTTFFSAQSVLGDAKAQNPDDKVLAKTRLDDPWSWTSIQTAMQVVLQSLPVQRRALTGSARAGY